MPELFLIDGDRLAIINITMFIIMGMWSVMGFGFGFITDLIALFLI